MAVGNIKQWLDQSDVDYFTHFVKAWIPFNAWYRENYPAVRSERDILDQVKIDGNRMRSRVMARLDGSDPECEEMRNHIASLHRRLSSDPLQDRAKQRITFESVCVGANPLRAESKTSYGWVYEVERLTSPNQVVCRVTNKSGVVVANIVQPGRWDVGGFEVRPDVQSLDANKRAVLMACYQAVHPLEFRTLLADAKERSVIEMDGYRFVSDQAAIFAGLVDVLYGMRNLLFHGELVPDPQANRTYEPAYHLLRHFLATIT